jgi:PKD repeat protein
MTPPTVYVSGNNTGDFNCSGTNDHILINQALQFVAENSDYTTVHLKGPFTYVINGTLLIGNNTILEGDSSAVLKLADNAGWKEYVPLIQQNNSSGNQNITIKGFTIDGNHEGNENVTSGVTSGKDYYYLISLINCTNIGVYDMYLTNSLGDGLRTNRCSNIKFHDNKAYSLGHDVLSTIKCSDVEAYNNRITCRINSGLRAYNTNNVRFYSNSITSEGYGGAGIQIQKEGNGYNMDDIEVYNNTIYRTALAGIWIFGSGSYLNSSTNVHVHHNQIYDTGTNSSRKEIGGIVSDGFNVTIENNVIDGARGVGIAQKNVYSSSPLDGLGYVITVRNNIIANIQSSLSKGDGVGVSNFLTGTHSFVLQNNCFYNNSGGNYSDVDAGLGDIEADPQYADRDTHDYHLMSKAGRWTGIAWVNDSVSSSCIDAGYSLSDYSKEPKPNGNRINIGVYGNTEYASKSESNESTPILPVADFSTNVGEGYAPLTVQFNDSSKNTTSVSWDFNGDGTADSVDRNPVYEFTIPGSYTVNLIASNVNGTNSKSATIRVFENLIFPGYTSLPTDPDHDGSYEDINGNGIMDFDDVVAYYVYMDWISENTPVTLFDYNNNNIIDFDDVVKLYNLI